MRVNCKKIQLLCITTENGYNSWAAFKVGNGTMDTITIILRCLVSSLEPLVGSQPMLMPPKPSSEPDYVASFI